MLAALTSSKRFMIPSARRPCITSNMFTPSRNFGADPFVCLSTVAQRQLSVLLVTFWYLHFAHVVAQR
jgi:hypothetical protein